MFNEDKDIACAETKTSYFISETGLFFAVMM